MSADLAALLDLSWKLLLVLGLAVLATRALRWLSSPSLSPSSALKLVARLPVGPQQSVTLLAVGSKRILVGVTTQQVTLLAELDPEDLAPDVSGESVVAAAPAWSSALRDLLTGRASGTGGTTQMRWNPRWLGRLRPPGSNRSVRHNGEGIPSC